ncbi:MAG: hypothetical protein R2880_03400 [Deinococcales bacterium]
MTLNNETLSFRELLSYVLFADVSEKVAEHFMKQQEAWDESFRECLENFAYEFRPDLAVWEIKVNESNQLEEQRLPMLPLN